MTSNAVNEAFIRCYVLEIVDNSLVDVYEGVSSTFVQDLKLQGSNLVHHTI